jgi:hypothetical protein
MKPPTCEGIGPGGCHCCVEEDEAPRPSSAVSQTVQTSDVDDEPKEPRARLPVGVVKRAAMPGFEIPPPPKLEKMGVVSDGASRTAVPYQTDPKPRRNANSTVGGDNIGFNIGGLCGVFSSAELDSPFGSPDADDFKWKQLRREDIPPMPTFGEDIEDLSPMGQFLKQFEKKLPPLPKTPNLGEGSHAQETTPASADALEPPTSTNESPLASRTGNQDTEQTAAGASNVSNVSPEADEEEDLDPNVVPMEGETEEEMANVPKPPDADYSPSNYAAEQRVPQTPAHEKRYGRAEFSPEEYRTLAGYFESAKADRQKVSRGVVSVMVASSTNRVLADW